MSNTAIYTLNQKLDALSGYVKSSVVSRATEFSGTEEQRALISNDLTVLRAFHIPPDPSRTSNAETLPVWCTNLTNSSNLDRVILCCPDRNYKRFTAIVLHVLDEYFESKAASYNTVGLALRLAAKEANGLGFEVEVSGKPDLTLEWADEIFTLYNFAVSVIYSHLTPPNPARMRSIKKMSFDDGHVVLDGVLM